MTDLKGALTQALAAAFAAEGLDGAAYGRVAPSDRPDLPAQLRPGHNLAAVRHHRGGDEARVGEWPGALQDHALALEHVGALAELDAARHLDRPRGLRRRGGGKNK